MDMNSKKGIRTCRFCAAARIRAARHRSVFELSSLLGRRSRLLCLSLLLCPREICSLPLCLEKGLALLAPTDLRLLLRLCLGGALLLAKELELGLQL